MRYRDGLHVPGVWAPSDPECRDSAVALLFPELAAPAAGSDSADGGGAAPVELTVGVFAAERQQAVLEALQPSSERLLAVTLRNVSKTEAEALCQEQASALR